MAKEINSNTQVTSPQIWDHFNSGLRHLKEGQSYFQPSITIPDLNMSLKEILTRHAMGHEMDDYFDAIYEEEGVPTSGIDVRTLDFTDLQRLRLENFQRMEESKLQAIKEDQEAKQRKAEEKAKADEAETNRLRAIAAEMGKEALK